MAEYVEAGLYFAVSLTILLAARKVVRKAEDIAKYVEAGLYFVIALTIILKAMNAI